MSTRLVVIDARGYFTQGGIGRYTRELVHAVVAQASADIRFRLLISKQHKPDDLDLVRPQGPAPANQIDVVVSRAEWLNAAEEEEWLGTEISDADLFHSLTGHWLPEDCPCIATLHDLLPLVRPDLVSPQTRDMAATIARMLPRASEVIAVSEATARDARAILGSRVPPVRVVHEAASAAFAPRAYQTRLLVKHRLIDAEFVLAVSALNPHKNATGLIDAFAQSGVRGPLVIVGAHRGAADDAREAITRDGLRHRIRLLGRLPDEGLAALYAACRFFVYPSLYEGFGLPALEAMACGAPVIASTAASIPEITGDAAVLVDPEDTRALASAIRALDGDRGQREALRARSLARAREFSWEKTAEKTLNTYNTVITHHEDAKARRTHNDSLRVFASSCSVSRMGVIVPHYKQTEFLGECLDSLLAQTRPPDEILVIDSSSQDTREVMAKYAGRVRHLIAMPAGVAAARNMGIRSTDADLVSFLDADNIAMPDCLDRQERGLRDNPNAVLCHANIVPIDRTGRTYDALSQYGSGAVPFDEQLGWLIDRNRVATDTVCARRDAILAAGGFCETRGVREDYDLWLKLAATGPFAYINAPIAKYRRHETNLSNDAAYMFEWEAGALRNIDWETTAAALARAFPDPHRRAIAEGEVRLRRGESFEAKRCFERVIDGPQSSAALFHLANFAVDGGALSAAAACLARALQDSRDDAALWNNLGVTLARQAQAASALCAFDRALSLRPTYDDASQNLRGLMHGGAAFEWRVTRRRLRPELMPMSAAA